MEFNLKQKGTSNTHTTQYQRVWTQEEQSEKLKGYLEVPREYWDQIKYGTHTRYITKTDGFRPGGFVLKNPLDTKPKGSNEEKRFIKLQNGFNDKVGTYAQWVVAYDDLDKLFIKPDASTLIVIDILEQSVRGLNENIRKMAEHIKKMESRLAALER